MLARIAYDREDYPRALQLLQDVITVHPKSGKWQLYLKLLQKMGMENELEEARQSYDAIKTARRYQNRASRYEAQGKPEAALNNYQKALELNPGEPHYYFSIGSVLESLPENEYEFQLQEATAYYKAAWELFPNNPFYAISYVGNLINTDQWENAFEVAKSAALKYPELMLPNLRFLVQVLAKEKEYEELLQEITDSDPQGELTEIRSEMAMILGEKGDPAAKEWFAKASSLYRDKIEMYPYNWHYYYDYGSCLAEQEDLPRARENLIKALELYGDFSVNVAEKLSSILYRMACYDEARLLLEALVMSNPRDYEYLGRMGMCFLAVADYQKGLEAFNRSLILNRNVPEYLYGAGVCAAHLNRAEDVINIIKDLLEMNDQFIEVIEQEPAFARMDGKEKFFQLVEGRKEKRTAALARQAGD
jgi:tetratricopeptide (TPR) repeat protein